MFLVSKCLLISLMHWICLILAKELFFMLCTSIWAASLSSSLHEVHIWFIMAPFYHIIDHGNHTSLSIAQLSLRGMTEGITLLILAVQTGLIELQVIHRAFLLSIILFIVVASILQSMLEIADPIVLALGASRDKYIRMIVYIYVLYKWTL